MAPAPTFFRDQILTVQPLADLEKKMVKSSPQQKSEHAVRPELFHPEGKSVKTVSQPTPFQTSTIMSLSPMVSLQIKSFSSQD